MGIVLRISGFLLFLYLLPGIISAQDNDSFPEFSSWKISTDFPIFTADNLWDYINGAATIYLQYGFTDLRIAEYSKGKKTITLEIYHHNSSENAFGMYSQERYADYHFMNIGAQGYQQGPVLNFLLGEYYVKMMVNSNKSSSIKALIDLAGILSQQLDGEDKLPEVLQNFPEEGKIDNTENFIAINFLGHEFFTDVYTSKYKVGEERFTLFLSIKDRIEDCQMILENYVDFTQQDLNIDGPGYYLLEDKFNGDIHMVWQDNIIIGVLDSENKELVHKYLELLKLNTLN